MYLDSRKFGPRLQIELARVVALAPGFMPCPLAQAHRA